MKTDHINQPLITLFSLVAALGGLLFGFDTAIISGTIPQLRTFFALDDWSLGWAVGCILIGCATGAGLAGRLADRYGRRHVLIICALLFAASGIGAGMAGSFSVFILSRITGGLGVGAAAMISPMYISEIVPAERRGSLVSLYQLAIVSGILLAYLSNYFFQHYAGADSWRMMFASQALPALLFFVLLLRVPETPRWLVMKGKSPEAMAILVKINGERSAIAEISGIRQSFEEAPGPKQNNSFRALFSGPYRSMIWTGILIAVFQQVTGINAVLYYAPVIFKQTGLDGSSSLLQTAGIGAVNVLSTFIAIGLVDRVGRKRFLLTGSLLMGTSLFGLSVCFDFQYFQHFIVLVLMLVYVGAFGCTLGAVTWVYLSEIFPNRIRGLALSVATLALWLADFAVTYTFPVISANFGTSGTFLGYSFCCAAAFIFLLRIPETRGKSLEEIEPLFNNSF